MFYNVFEYKDKRGVTNVWDAGKRYPTKEEAESFKDVAPDAGWVYVETREESEAKLSHDEYVGTITDLQMHCHDVTYETLDDNQLEILLATIAVVPEAEEIFNRLLVHYKETSR